MKAAREHDMGLIAVPNVSEGRNVALIKRLEGEMAFTGARVLDIHSDALHNRSVFTVAGDDEQLIDAAVTLASNCLEIDLTAQQGLHPRLGGLDVCPFVPLGSDLDLAVETAVSAAKHIAEETGLPVFLYEAAAAREETRSLPTLRRGGLQELGRRVAAGLTPDFGPSEIDRRRGVVCVGARRTLIAFNVILRSGASEASVIAATVRTSGGGRHGIRALGWALEPGRAQVSMNLTDPQQTGIDAVFDVVAHEAQRMGVEVIGTEIVGLPPERFMPDPQKEAARLLIRPGRSLENALRN